MNNSKLSNFRVTIKYKLHYTFFVFLSLLLFTCSNPTEPNKGSLSGHITLLNDIGDASLDTLDFSGVTVALYELAPADTALSRINIEYPQTGVQLSQFTEFDHRKMPPIKTSSLNNDGTFELENIVPGQYNIALFSNTWGVKYLYNILVEENLLTNVGEIVMYPLVRLSGSIIGAFVFQENHHYLIENNTDFVGAVIINAPSQISVVRNSIIRFYGEVHTPVSSNPYSRWRFNSASGFFLADEYEIDSSDYYASIAFYNNNTILESGDFQHSSNSIGFSGAACSLSNMYFTDCTNGISVNQASVSISNCTFSRITQNAMDIISNSVDQSIQSSVFFMCDNAISIATGNGLYNVSDCYFIDNNYCIRPDFCSGNITHNNFDKNSRDIYQYQVYGNPIIAYNNFYYSRDLTILPRKTAIINNNNFFWTDRCFIDLRNDAPPYSIVLHDIDARNNYWQTEDVDSYIVDGNDNDQYPAQPCPHFVIYLPKTSHRISSAGIRG